MSCRRAVWGEEVRQEMSHMTLEKTSHNVLYFGVWILLVATFA